MTRRELFMGVGGAAVARAPASPTQPVPTTFTAIEAARAADAVARIFLDTQLVCFDERQARVA